MRLVFALATATAALLLGLAGAGVGGAFAAGGAPAADPYGDGIFDDLAAQVADAPVSARVNVIVTLDRPATAAVVATLQQQVGPFSLGRLFTVVDGFSATVTGPQVALLAAAPAVVHVERNGTVGISNQPGNLAFGVTQSRIDGTGTSAAVIDTGIDPAHVDIAGKVVAFVDCLLPDLAPVCSVVPAFDDHGHGSHVAGTIAGTGAAGGGAERGVAPGATLVGVKVLDASGSGSEAGVIAGIQWVIANRATYGIRAINMSLSDTGCSDGTDALSQAANEAAAAGIVVAVAAGTTNGYSTLSGTSMATPFVAGLALLLQQQNPALTPLQVKAFLAGTAIDFGLPGPDVDYGSGRVDAYAALRAAGAAINTPPSQPSHTTAAGTLEAGQLASVPIAVTGSSFPLAATVLMEEWAGGATMSLTLLRPDGTTAATSTLGTRHERVLVTTPTPGTWTLRITATAHVVWQLDVSAQLGVGLVAVATAPSVTGTAVEGASLAGLAGSWTGLAPQFTTLRWLRCDAAGAACAPVAGAVSASYPLVAADIGATLRLEATVANWLGYQRVSSAATDVVAAAAPVAAAPPAVLGTVAGGQTVTAAPGSWTSSLPVTFSYAWQLCDAATSTACSAAGAGPSLPLPATATGYRLRLTVTASNAGGSTDAVALSAAVAPGAPTALGLVPAGSGAGAAGGGYATVAPLPGEAGRERIEFALRVTTGGVVYGKQLTLPFREGGLSYVLRTSAVDTGGLFLAPGATPQRAFFLGAAAVAQVAANGVETPLPGVYRVTVDRRDLAEPGAGFDTFAAWVGTPSGTTFHQAGSSAAQLVLASGNVGFRRS